MEQQKERLTISDKIELLKLACQVSAAQYKERYQEMVSLILQNKPTSQD